MSTPKPYLLVDGHSVIFQRETLRRLHARNTRAARQQLIQEMARLHDSGAWLVTLVFDGRQGGQDPIQPDSLVVLYSKDGQTADSIIERLVASVPDPSRVHVVTADHQEALMVESLGATVHNPPWLEDLQTRTDEEARRTLDEIRRRAKW